MGKLGLSSGSNVKGGKSISNKKKEKFAHKKMAKKAAVDKSLIEKTPKVRTKGQKGSILGKSSLTSANKGHKQFEDADSDTEEEVVDTRDNENSSDDESEESGSENMQDGSDADGNDAESDVAQDDDEDDDDDDDDDDVDDNAPTDIEEPKIKDGGKTFRAKKRPGSDFDRKKLTDIKRKKNYPEPEPVSSKVDGNNLPRKKQEELFQPCKWDDRERVKTSEVNFDKWL